MFQYFNERFIKGNISIGIECRLDGNEEIYFIFSIIKNSKSGFHIISQSEEFLSLEELIRNIPKKYPLILGISGKQVLFRKLNIQDDETDDVLLNRILPNANLEDFYLQKQTDETNSISIGIIRQIFVDKIVASLVNHGYTVYDCILGPFHIPSLLALINVSEPDQIFYLPQYKLRIEESKLVEIEIGDYSNYTQNIELSESIIYKNSINSTALALVYFYPLTATIDLSVDDIQKSKSDFIHKKNLRFASLIFIGIILILLTVNFTIISTIKNKISDYSSLINQNEDKIIKFQHLKSELDIKQQMLVNSGLMQASRTSFFADQIVMSLPDAVLLNQLDIQPAKIHDNSGEEEIIFSSNKIYIEGICKEPSDLNSWIDSLKTYSWINDVSLLNYSNDQEEKKAKFQMEISMK